MDYIEVSAKTVDEAITKACIELSKASTDLDIIVVSQGSKGFLGIGSKPAVIKAAIKAEEKVVVKETVKEEKKTPKKPVKETKAAKEVKEVKEVKEPAASEVKAPKPEAKKERSETEKPKNNDHKKDNNRKKNNKKNYSNDKKEEKRPSTHGDSKKPDLKEEIVEKTEEEIANMKEASEKFLKDVFGAMNIGVELNMNYVKEGGCLEINLSGDDMGVLIGKRGQTLDSLQYLTSLVVNKTQKDYVRVKLDTEDYRRRRKETLENLAKNIASRVKKTRKTVVLEPMNPYERRIIHSSLQSNKYVETYSEGNEPYRHVVVTLKKSEKN